MMSFLDHIYPTELERKDTTYVARYASYIALHIEIDREGHLRTKLSTSEIISIFILYLATFLHRLHMQYLPLS
jgi:hypothetical protein